MEKWWPQRSAAKRAAEKAGWDAGRIAAFLKDARSGNYEHLLAVCCEHFDVR